MSAGLSVALALLIQAATAASPVVQAATSANPGNSEPAYGPVAAVPSPPVSPPSDQSERQCVPQKQDPKANDIVVCAVKPDGYRLPPDIVEARRLKKEGVTIRPHNPHETFADHSCATVGPMGCRGTPTLNMLAVAATAAEISKRLAKGQEVGSVFETEKASSDYQYYLEAKKEREAKESAAAAAAARAKAVAATKAMRQLASQATQQPSTAPQTAPPAQTPSPSSPPASMPTGQSNGPH